MTTAAAAIETTAMRERSKPSSENELTCDMPSGVDFHAWHRAATLAKRDAEEKEEEKRRNEEKARTDEENVRSPRAIQVLGTHIEEEEEEEEDEGEEEEEGKGEEDTNRREDDETDRAEKKSVDEKKMLKENLRKEKIKNRVMERNVKAEAVCEKKKSGEAKSALLLYEEERKKEKRMNKDAH